MAGSALFWFSYAALWALTLLLGVATILLLRDLGHRRLVSRDGRKLQGPSLNETWPSLEVPTPEGLMQLPKPGVSQIVIVGAKRCGLCRHAMLTLGEIAVRTRSSLECIFVYPGTREEMRLHIGEAPPAITVIHDVKNVVRRRLGIVVYPYAMSVDATGRVRHAIIAHRRRELDTAVAALDVEQEAVVMAS
jgi:hypothetical protein